jgi:hypothetical protein
MSVCATEAKGFIAQKTCDEKPYLDYAARRAKLRRERNYRAALLGMTVLAVPEGTKNIEGRLRTRNIDHGG